MKEGRYMKKEDNTLICPACKEEIVRHDSCFINWS